MTLTVKPQWIARMYPSKVGRDHLGLGSVSSDQILPSLSPGINVLTIHPRYHSFYAFLLDEFWRRDRARTQTEWVHFYRPRAFIFSLGANLCDQPEHGEMGSIVGGQKTGPLARRQLEHYDTAFNYIKSPLGGYGLYYRSVMAELELVYPGGRGLPYPVDVPTEQGKRLAQAFRSAVEYTAYYRNYFDEDQTRVPIQVIREYMRRACLCQLQKRGASDRKLLLEHFLHQGLDPAARRATLRMMLDIADQIQGYSVEQDEFRQLLYFGETDAGATYAPIVGNRETYLKWRLYQCREYYAFALNALWCHLCDWGLKKQGDLRPVPLAQFWEYLEGVLDWASLAAPYGVPNPQLSPDSRFQDLLDWLRGCAGPVDEMGAPNDAMAQPIQEHKLYRDVRKGGGAGANTVPAMLTMLGLIVLRFGQPKLWLSSEWQISRMGDTSRLSVHGFLQNFTDRSNRASMMLQRFIRWLYTDYVILQHQLIANSKLPDNTFRFRREGDTLRFYNLWNSLGFNDSRFEALSTTVHELGLCGDFRETRHPLTDDGQQLLEEGDIP